MGEFLNPISCDGFFYVMRPAPMFLRFYLKASFTMIANLWHYCISSLSISENFVVNYDDLLDTH